jgi:antitoxin YefM
VSWSASVSFRERPYARLICAKAKPPNRDPQGRHVATLVAMTVDPLMTLRDVKNHLSEVVDQVEREHDRVVITKHGRPAAVVLSIADLESLEETLDVMARPKLLAHIRDSLAELQSGPPQVLTKEQARQLLIG